MVRRFMKLALMLLHEQELGEASRLAPYLQYLPTEFNTPFIWSDQELQQLGYPFLTQQVPPQTSTLSTNPCPTK